MTSVRDIMNQRLITCSPKTSLGEVAGLLRQHRIHAIVVSDESKHAVGVVSDTDLLAGEWLGDSAENVATLKRMTAGELMTQPIATIDFGATAWEAAVEIQRLHVARLVVTKESMPVGVVSISDLLVAVPHHTAGRARVRDVMSWGYVACRPTTPVHGAVRAMLERNSRSLLVIDDGGRLVGVVTGFDLLPSLADESPSQRVVSEYMHPPITTGPDATLREAIDLMLTKDVHRLVVTDPEKPNGLPMGLISTTDIIVEMAAPTSTWRS
jgi:CBS domain-containing protein